MPTSRGAVSTVEFNGKIYVFGGGDSREVTEEYDPSTDTCMRKANVPTPRSIMAVCVLNDKIYVLGGQAGMGTPGLKTVEVYDPATDTWETAADMITGRYLLAAETVDGKIYAIGGSYEAAMKVVEEYDPATNSWTSKNEIPTPRREMASAVIDGKIYIIGGSGGTNVVEVYDPTTDTWERKTNMPTARVAACADVVNGFIYVIGGDLIAAFPYGQPVATNEEYDPVTDSWVKRAPMPSPRSFMGVNTVDDKIYAIGGQATGYPFTRSFAVEVYTPPEEAPYIIKSSYILDDNSGNNNGRTDAGETVDLTVTLRNIRLPATNVSARLSTNDPDIQLINDTAKYGEFGNNQYVDNTASPFSFSVASPCISKMATLYLIITADGGYASMDSIEMVVGTPTIMLVDDDNGADYENYFLPHLNRRGVYPEYWKNSIQTCSLGMLQQYDAVIWFTGDDRISTLTAEQQSVLADYLDNGGRLFLTGQDIGFDLVGDGSQEDSMFFANYLHAEFIADTANANTSPDKIKILAPTEKILNYIPCMTCGGLKYEDDVSGTRLIYLPFGFEGIAGANDCAEKLLHNFINWLSGATSIEQSAGVNSSIQKFILAQNYSNPFNALTTIKYHLPR